MNPQRYPIGQQNFVNIRKEGKVYIDKKELIYNIITGSSNYIFQSQVIWQKPSVVNYTSLFRGE